jgi:hypothetical protein
MSNYPHLKEVARLPERRGRVVLRAGRLRGRRPIGSVQRDLNPNQPKPRNAYLSYPVFEERRDSPSKLLNVERTYLYIHRTSLA